MFVFAKKIARNIKIYFIFLNSSLLVHSIHLLQCLLVPDLNIKVATLSIFIPAISSVTGIVPGIWQTFKYVWKEGKGGKRVAARVLSLYM